MLDYQPYEKSFYSPSNGCDAASADVNKIFRAACASCFRPPSDLIPFPVYLTLVSVLLDGEEVEYQRLAYRARAIWSQWNIDIASTPPSSLPPCISPSTRLFYPSGFLRLPLHPTSPLSEKELSSLSHIASESASLRAQNYVLSNPEDVQRAKSEGWAKQLDLWTDLWTEKGGDGVFDATAGFVRADKACVWMRWLAEREGVEFVLGEEGRVKKVIEEGQCDEKRAVGVETTDGKVHSADLVIVACECLSLLFSSSAFGHDSCPAIKAADGRRLSFPKSKTISKLPADRLLPSNSRLNPNVQIYGKNTHPRTFQSSVGE